MFSNAKYLCYLDFERCPTEVERYENVPYRECRMVFMAFTQVRFERMPRWNDRVVYADHRYRVTSVHRQPDGKPVVTCRLVGCKLTRAQELARLSEEELCRHCNEVALDNMYMVKDELWDKIEQSRGDLVCMRCFEQRLGRKLQAADFTDAFINEINPTVKALRAPALRGLRAPAMSMSL